ncbi:hypothetical protein FOXG_16341 [Fusarium oxysporum f. sp. lycopersici 4287]|uniref:Uncharacterized protein n=1 Tax=Fusarium oxysporum f. sp. lycopersici (strain 4287 / CBS 123668 / FGSC 9935 / NRRL 34936) TaxID=426428 RepID=A0A0J9W8B4_FUSO4|nr:hypothetical protein FOXG_06755 [Fusarium oxysporum f. sp. lycopersici 4287]XP_018244684.1 hypothetical protein FOXG_07315 [Fusarium oxysporum f. sp. lycopersici 4287]XP_018256985.1 uncharacterized protein FOXG_16341 [Fusarium oxysporum f. sp. lycopersici 4287]KAJ9419244.1 hypothetical protein QL093DRAFT_2015371 [Fusarium oxysporum]KNB04715.1 hypothetical protein FOXG_06755 [Fusarium oxysporum f. sp. lycopersici 4287]KNB06639.1 hypothetical protein FOXG_07315 [Fusarium oxysporum f. sp. lyco
MVFSLTESNGLGNITIKDADSQNITSGNVQADGRVKVQFHQHAQSVVSWFKGCQSRAVPTEPFKKRSCNTVSLNSQQLVTTPRLNIAIHIIGSRGDVQPFIPVAQALSRPPYSHRVRICTHPVFKHFIESQGIEFFSIGGDPEALMAYMVKNPGLLPSRKSVKAGEIKKRREEMWEILIGAWRSCIEAGDGMGDRVMAANVRETKDLFIADAIIANPPSMAHIHCAEKLGIPLHMVFTMPWSPTERFSHPLASMTYRGSTDGAVANYLSYIVMELLTWQGLGDLINRFRTRILCLDSISPLWGYQLLTRLRVPYSYLWSQSLIPKPSDWGSHINITGFSFLSLANHYMPTPDLVGFLEKGPPPIYIGFGSIVIEDPPALTQLIFDAVKLAGVRAIISRGWGGIGRGDIPETICLIGDCPHDWLFQRVSAVVHHGGAGTTAAGIAAGRPTVIVPFFGDQPFWGQMIAQAGAGPTPIPFKELTAEILASSIIFSLKTEVQEAVQKMAERIGAEDGACGTAVDFQERLDIDHLRCDICPDRLAVWRHKTTGTHLSGFAAACLVDKGLLDPRDFKLLKHKHWYVDEGAEHPIVGAVAAASNFVITLGTAASDFSQRLKNRPRWSSRDNKAILPQMSWYNTNRDIHQPTLTVNHNEDHDVSSTAREAHQGPPPNTNGNGMTIAELTNPTHNGILKDSIRLAPTELENFAHKMATKSLLTGEIPTPETKRVPTLHERRKATWKAQEQGPRGHMFYIMHITGRFAADVAKAGLKVPVALVYNVANGFHNYPSYTSNAVEVRQRNEITGLGSGACTAGREFVLGLWDAFSGVVIKPYQGAKAEAGKGFGKGMWNGTLGFVYNLGAGKYSIHIPLLRKQISFLYKDQRLISLAIFGLLGYTLKGIEKEFSKHHLTSLKAEILLIRLRQGIDDFSQATPEGKEMVVERWRCLQSQ